MKPQHTDSFAETILEWAEAIAADCPDDPQWEYTCQQRVMSRLGEEMTGGWKYPVNLRYALLAGMNFKQAQRKDTAILIKNAVDAAFPGRVKQL